MINSSASTIYGRRKLKEEAEASLLKQPTESTAIEHLWETKPAYLTPDGGDLWIDQKNVDTKIAEIILKFKINSFHDRAERFDYLQDVLRQKWANKPDIFNSMMCFLIEMSDRPTEVLEFKVDNQQYSGDVDVERELDREEFRQVEIRKREFRQEMVQDLLKTRLELSYSSDEELSDWGETSESESEELPVLRQHTPVPANNSIPELPVPTESEKQETVCRFWNDQKYQSNSYILSHLRSTEPTPMIDQPVISNLMTLYTRFGELWEWKEAGKSNRIPSKMVVEEYDIIRELLWQFTSPNSQNSLIFTPEWNLRPSVMISSLTFGALESLLGKYGQVFSKLQCMKEFIRLTPVVDSYPSMFRAYASSLSQVLTFIIRGIDEVERKLKIEMNLEATTCTTRPASTLIQFDSATRRIIDLILQLEILHSEAVYSPPSTPNWLKSLKLISTLEFRLNLEPDSQVYGLDLYIFSKCLPSFFDLLLKPLQLTFWDNNEFLFQQNTTKVTNSNFWNEIVTIQPIEEEFRKMSLVPISCVEIFSPKVLTLLKIQEILNQLDNVTEFQCGTLLSKSLPCYETMITQFLSEVLVGLRPENVVSITPQVSTSISQKSFRQELDHHLSFLGLKGSIIAGAFESLLSRDDEGDSGNESSKPTPYCWETISTEIESFWNLPNVPLLTTGHRLVQVMEESLLGYFAYGESALWDLFQRYKVVEAVELLREIVFGGKEEFATAASRLANNIRYFELRNNHLPDGDEDPNTKFQNMLNYFYPDGRGTFVIEFRYIGKGATNFELKIQPLFPLTLLLTPRTVANYEYVSGKIFEIRKCVWLLIRLNFADCKPGLGVELYKLFLLRFNLIHFWESLRSFVLISVFELPKESRDFLTSRNSDINDILKYYEHASEGPLYRILSFKIVEAVIIKPVILSTMTLIKNWKTGISILEITKLSERVRCAWEMILELGSGRYPSEINEIAQFYGPVPDIFF